MERQLRVISGSGKEAGDRGYLTSEEKLKHFRNIMGVFLKDAQSTWGDLWNQFEGEMVDGVVVLPKEGEGFTPRCGWPEFLEKMWLLKHHLDHAKGFTETKM